MRSLTYLLFCGTKNRILEILRSPAKLIAHALGLAGLLFFVVYFTFFSAVMHDIPDGEIFDPNFNHLKGVIFLFFAFTFLVSALTGLKGTSSYGMEDVNFLFVSPIRARTILLYGIIKSFKTILLGSWFIFLQAAWLQNGFGIGADGVLLLFCAYVLFALVCRVLCIFLYAVTLGDAKRIFRAKLLIFISFLPLVAEFFLLTFAEGWDFLAGIFATAESVIVDITPIVGWAAAGTLALATGDFLFAAIQLGLIGVFGIILVAYLFLKDHDYYEHVAGVTQTEFEKTRAVESGDVQSVAVGATNKNARVKSTGIYSGHGASVFFFKHVRETFRAKKFGLWGFSTFLYVAGAGIFAAISLLQVGYEETVDTDSIVFSILTTMLIIGFFMLSAGRGSLELYSHYIYMVPENPLKKWLWANAELFFKEAVQAVFIFGVPWYILQCSPENFIIAGVVYVFFAFYMHGVSLAFLRFTGITSRSVILSLLMTLLYIVPLVPGVALAFLAGFLMSGYMALTVGMFVFALWLFGAGFAFFALSKGVLHDCDMISLDGFMQKYK
jgi:hypothetical protein